MKTNDFREMLGAMAAGWTDRDYERVAANFADDLFYSDSLHYSFSTNEELLNFFQDDEGYPQICVFHQSVFNEEMQLGAAEYTYKGTYTYHGTVWIKIENDKIINWREYQYISEKNRDEFWQGKA